MSLPRRPKGHPDFGRIDFAHNNAGVAGANLPIAELPDDEWDRVMAVMLRGVSV